MPSVTAYQAGLESTNTNLSYALESAWATLPAATFQSARIISESLKHTKTRTRPGEIRGDRQAAPAITTQESAAGDVVLPVYFGAAGFSSPFDDFAQCLLGGTWQAQTTITGVGGDIVQTVAGGVAVLTSTTANKFANILVGQIVKLNGFTNTVNNGFYRVSVVTSSTNITLVPQGFVPVSETPAGAAAKLFYSGLRNGLLFQSLYLQQRLDPAASKFFRYPGAYPTKGALSLSLGQFFQATFSFAAQQELKGTGDASTGGIVTAPNTNDMDPVSGFKGVYWNDALVTSGVDQFSFDLSNDGAAGQYALGSALAQGMLGGTFMGAGKARLYFRDFTYYDQFRAETPGVLSIRTGDQFGNSYAFTAANALLMLNSGVNADGPNKSLMAEFDIEMSPSTSTGCTLNIDRFPASA